MQLADMVEELDESESTKLNEWERKFIGDMKDRLVKVDYDDEKFENRLSVKEKLKISQIYEDRA